MTVMTSGVKPMTAYAPPSGGKPRDAVDAKWMRLHRMLADRPNRAMRKKIDGEHLPDKQP
ncbi:hypothetical protein [uncultured Bifidobacterium sp.]|uniref:hypothetical protein n=1 Tax=uncultured Bifidobacterium sp. TaxID=165187 RepID=UPI00259824CB|nr:hypothetical protein [uncultured Bifidobacterium sp.]